MRALIILFSSTVLGEARMSHFGDWTIPVEQQDGRDYGALELWVIVRVVVGVWTAGVSN